MSYTRHVDMSEAQIANLVAWKRIVARAWTDAAFKADLLAKPTETLAANGFTVPAGITYKIVEDQPTVKTMILPAAPAAGGPLVEHGSNSSYDPGF